MYNVINLKYFTFPFMLFQGAWELHRMHANAVERETCKTLRQQQWISALPELHVSANVVPRMHGQVVCQ